MTSRVTETFSHLEDTDLEQHRPPVVLYLAGTVAIMNVCATVLSLMTWTL